MRHLPVSGYEIVQNRKVARPERFERPTLRFVVLAMRQSTVKGR
jgi:hypothetical protein